MATESFDKQFVVTDEDVIKDLQYALVLTKEQTSEERYKAYTEACLGAQTRAAIKRIEEWVKDHPLDKDIIDKYKDIDDGGVLAGKPARE